MDEQRPLRQPEIETLVSSRDMTCAAITFHRVIGFRCSLSESTSPLRATSRPRTSGSSWNQSNVRSIGHSTPSKLYSAVTPSWSTWCSPPTQPKPISSSPLTTIVTISVRFRLTATLNLSRISSATNSVSQPSRPVDTSDSDQTISADSATTSRRAIRQLGSVTLPTFDGSAVTNFKRWNGLSTKLLSKTLFALTIGSRSALTHGPTHTGS